MCMPGLLAPRLTDTVTECILSDVTQASAFSPVALFFRTTMWQRWGVVQDNIHALTPYNILDTKPPYEILEIKEEFMIADDAARPYYGPVFWILFEELLPILTHFNTCVLVSDWPLCECHVIHS